MLRNWSNSGGSRGGDGQHRPSSWSPIDFHTLDHLVTYGLWIVPTGGMWWLKLRIGQRPIKSMFATGYRRHQRRIRSIPVRRYGNSSSGILEAPAFKYRLSILETDKRAESEQKVLLTISQKRIQFWQHWRVYIQTIFNQTCKIWRYPMKTWNCEEN